ncbi:hypothetical protein GRJ2_001730600 [Grus japonensis]|uniref:Uncharacterized protein n=1 Tax=Grus japonensis TaxID=30415 RepID=A0ABC9X4Q1_GRUJA
MADGRKKFDNLASDLQAPHPGEESLTIFVDKRKLSKRSEGSDLSTNSSAVTLETLHQLAASYFIDRDSTLRRLHHIQIASTAIKGFVPQHSIKHVHEEAKVCSPEVQGSELAVCPPHCPEDLELHHFMVTAAKAALELHIPYQPLLVGENKVQNGTSPCWVLYHLEKEVIIDAFQEPPGLLMPCCVVPPTDIRVTEVPHKDQGLQM